MSDDDPYYNLFIQVAHKKPYLQSTSQWFEYLDLLRDHGLLKDEELNRVRCALDTGTSSKENLCITFNTFQKIVLQSCSSKEYDGVAESVQNIGAQAHCFIELAEQWGIKELDEIQVHQLLTLLQDLEVSHSSSKAYVAQHGELQKRLLKNQSAYTFFWELLMKNNAYDDLYPGEGSTPFQFQFENTIAIERILYKRKLRHVKLAKCGTNLERLSDTFGHDQGGNSGIMIIKGIYPGKPEYKQGVQVIAISKHGISSKVMERVYNNVSAHREMALSKYVQQYLGSDLVTAIDDIFFYYENVQASSLTKYINATKYLDENSYIFKYWSRNILRAICNIQEQCTHSILQPIRLDNIFVSNSGTRILLGKLDYGDTIKGNTKNKLIEREKRLVSSFAIILHSILCPTTVPTNHIQFHTKYVAGDGKTQHDAPKVPYNEWQINVVVGDNVSFEFETQNECRWESAVVEGKSIIQTKSTFNHHLYYANVVGTCTIIFRSTQESHNLIEVEVRVHETAISPQLQAILRSCVGGSDNKRVTTAQAAQAQEFVRIPTLKQLSCHPQFYKSRIDDEEEMVIVEYERIKCQYFI